MNDTSSLLPLRLQAIVEDFRLCEGTEKLELLLEFSEQMPPLPEWLQSNRGSMEQVDECMTPVFVHAETLNGGMEFYFDVPAESPSVRGYAALLSEGVRGAAPQAILAIPNGFYFSMGLQEVLSGQRLNGMRAILSFIKRLAQNELDRNKNQPSAREADG